MSSRANRKHIRESIEQANGGETGPLKLPLTMNGELREEQVKTKSANIERQEGASDAANY